jgi:hypothetical protein
MPQMTSIRVDNKEIRVKVQYLEVLGRVLSGISPWLQLEAGSKVIGKMINLTHNL